MPKVVGDLTSFGPGPFFLDVVQVLLPACIVEGLQERINFTGFSLFFSFPLNTLLLMTSQEPFSPLILLRFSSFSPLFYGEAPFPLKLSFFTFFSSIKPFAGYVLRGLNLSISHHSGTVFPLHARSPSLYPLSCFLLSVGP